EVPSQIAVKAALRNAISSRRPSRHQGAGRHRHTRRAQAHRKARPGPASGDRKASSSGAPGACRTRPGPSARLTSGPAGGIIRTVLEAGPEWSRKWVAFAGKHLPVQLLQLVRRAETQLVPQDPLHLLVGADGVRT